MRQIHSVSRLSAVALSAVLAACGQGFGSGSDQARAAPATPAAKADAQWFDGRLEVDVPVPVISFGLTAEQAQALDAELDVHTVNHGYSDLNQVIRPDTTEVEERGPAALIPIVGGESFTLPVLPTADYQVIPAPAALEAEFKAALESVRISADLFDANAMEDWLAQALPRAGFPINPNAPSMVVLHLDAFGAGSHGWRITGPTGILDPVRLFGERHPLVVLDPSAVVDPYPGSGQDYMNPVGPDAAATIANYVRQATEFRVLQGSIYPVAQAPCHAITAIMGVRPTSLAETGLLLRPVEEALMEERIKAAFDNLTGNTVFFDLKVISLPVDDPVLDAISRGEFPLMEVLRGYLTLQWENYHVDHPGCEEYLSVVFQSDAGTVPGGGVLGIGTYDDNPGKRISMSWVHEAFRLLWDPEGPLPCQACDGKEYLNWWEYLISHETGHILGQRHPHDVNSSSSGASSSDAFSSIWSSMSYQQDGRMIDFGAIDRNNWHRNRAGFALEKASLEGREGTPAWNAAMQAAGALDWQGVWEALRQP